MTPPSKADVLRGICKYYCGTKDQKMIGIPGDTDDRGRANVPARAILEVGAMGKLRFGYNEPIDAM
jgi:hypothetical protein